MITKLDSLTDISTEFGVPLPTAAKMNWYYDNKNPASPVQPVMGGGRITDWIGYDHSKKDNTGKLSIKSRYDINGQLLSAYTGNLGIAVKDAQSNAVICKTGDSNVEVELNNFKYLIDSWPSTNPRIYADVEFNGEDYDINLDGKAAILNEQSEIIVDYHPKTLYFEDPNAKIRWLEIIITSDGNGSMPNGSTYNLYQPVRDRFNLCSKENIAQYFCVTIRFWLTKSITKITNYSLDSTFQEVLRVYHSSSEYDEGRNWHFKSNTRLVIE